MVGLIEDVKNFVTSCFKDEGDVIILLGKNAGEVGGSEYLASIHDTVGGIPPSLDYDVALRLIETCLAGIRRGIVKSAHDTSEGGLAVALAEASVCGKRPLGAVVELKDDLRRDFLLFGEDAMRIIVTTAPNDSSTMLEIAKSIGLHAEVIGLVGGTRFKINDWIDIPVSKILEAWSSGIYSIFNR
jgi:phosphoribosylformylglycinamidine synthase